MERRASDRGWFRGVGRVNTFGDGDPRGDPLEVDGIEIRSTVTVVERDGVLLFDVDHLGRWVRSSVVTDLTGTR